MENTNLYGLVYELLKWLLLPGTVLGIVLRLIKSYPEKILENIHLKILRKIAWELYIFIALLSIFIAYPIFVYNNYIFTKNLYIFLMICSALCGVLYLFSSKSISTENTNANGKVGIKILNRIIKLSNILNENRKYITVLSVLSVILWYYFTSSYILSFFNDNYCLTCKSGLELLMTKNIDFYMVYAVYPNDLTIRNINNIKISYLLVLVFILIINRLIIILFELSIKENRSKQYISIITVDGKITENYEYINNDIESFIVKDFNDKSYQFISKSIIAKVVLQDNIIIK